MNRMSDRYSRMIGKKASKRSHNMNPHMKLVCLTLGLFMLLFSSAKGFAKTEKTEEKHGDANDDYYDPPVEEFPAGLDPHGYLSKFGYTRESESVTDGPIDEETVKEATKLFQHFFSLPQTGEVDEDSVHLMHKVRCGNIDLESEGLLREGNEKITYQNTEHKWVQQTITYKIVRYPEKFKRQRRAINMIFAKAFATWSKFVDLEFKLVQDDSDNKEADIRIDFVRNDYGTCYRCALFAGSPSVVAHAFHPSKEPIGGDIHFNDLVDWSISNKQDGADDGVNLLAVAVHEIGHTLGLGHGQLPRTKMYPIINETMFGLDLIDAAGAQKMYGRRGARKKKPKQPSTTELVPIEENQWLAPRGRSQS